MKEYIDYQQLQELSFEEEDRLREMLFPGQDVYVLKNQHVTTTAMINILHKHSVDYVRNDEFLNICDSLWSQTKELLRQQSFLRK
jgi:hypothetical protein